MSAANKSNNLPEKKSDINQKTKLYNDILKWLKDQGVGFLSTNVNTLGANLLNTLTLCGI